MKGMSFRARLGLAVLGIVVAPAAAAFATAETPATALTEEQLAKGRQLFSDNGCNACHTLADAHAAGTIGPSFDGNAALDKSHAVSVITNGQGPMPNFGWLDHADIDLIASYIVQAKK